MLKLPNAEEKIREYLLNPEHLTVQAKRGSFRNLEFSVYRWQLLADALIRHGQNNPVSRVKETPFGPRYEVEGQLEAPDRRNPRIRTIWQHDHGTIAPRLITAYPMRAVL